MFLGCEHGWLFEYSLNQKEILYQRQIFDTDIEALATTTDGKTLFLTDRHGKFKEFNIESQNEENHFQVKTAQYVTVTYNNRYLITATNNGILQKHSMDTKQLKHSWKSSSKQIIRS